MNTVVRGVERARDWLDERGRVAWIAATVIGFVLFWPIGPPPSAPPDLEQAHGLQLGPHHHPSPTAWAAPATRPRHLPRGDPAAGGRARRLRGSSTSSGRPRTRPSSTSSSRAGRRRSRPEPQLVSRIAASRPGRAASQRPRIIRASRRSGRRAGAEGGAGVEREQRGEGGGGRGVDGVGGGLDAGDAGDEGVGQRPAAEDEVLHLQQVLGRGGRGHQPARERQGEHQRVERGVAERGARRCQAGIGAGAAGRGWQRASRGGGGRGRRSPCPSSCGSGSRRSGRGGRAAGSSRRRGRAGTGSAPPCPSAAGG